MYNFDQKIKRKRYNKNDFKEFQSKNPEENGITSVEDAVDYVYNFLEDNIPDYEFQFSEPSAIKTQAAADQAAGGTDFMSLSIALLFSIIFS